MADKTNALILLSPKNPRFQSGKVTRTVEFEADFTAANSAAGDKIILAEDLSFADRISGIFPNDGIFPILAGATDTDLGFYTRSENGELVPLEADILWDGVSFASVSFQSNMLTFLNPNLRHDLNIGLLLGKGVDEEPAGGVLLVMTMNLANTATATLRLLIDIDRATTETLLVVIPPPPLVIPTRSMDFASSKFLDMSDANFGAFDRSKLAISLWYKRFVTGATEIIFGQGDGSSNISFQLRFSLFDRIEAFAIDVPGNVDGHLRTTDTFADTTNWHHILYHFDSANATPGDRMRLWHDGIEITVFDVDVNPSAAVQDSASTVVIGTDSAGTGVFFNGKLYQTAFFSGSLPDISEVYDAGSVKDVTGIAGLHSLLNTDDVVALEDDFVLATDWTNNGGVAKSVDIP